MSAGDAVRKSVAAQLEGGARGYGAGAAERLHQHEGVPGAFSAWHEYYTQRVAELSVGVLLDEAQIAASGFEWAGAGLEARGVAAPESELLVESLRGSLREDLGDRAWAVVAPMLASIDASRPIPAGGEGRLVNDGGRQTRALRFLERTLSGAWREAIDDLTDMQREGVSTRELYEQVLLPAAVETGTMWHLGEIGISEEHAATEAILGAMSALWQRAEREAPNGVRVVVGSVTEDRHSIGVRATAWLLELSGCMSACLGSDLPAPDFARAVRDYEAGGVVIGATLVTHLPRAAETVSLLRELDPALRIIVGGPAFSVAGGLAEKVGADALAGSPGEVAGLLLG